MLKNYLKTTYKVLMRNKFYTVVSLFGISFTLMVLMVVTAFLDNELGSNRPMSNKDDILFLPSLEMKRWERKTTTTIDTIVTEDSIRYDTSIIETPLVGQPYWSSNTGLGYTFCKEHILTMSSPELVSIFAPGGQIEVYPDNQRLELSATMVDGNFWRIFDFEFIEGHGFTESAIDNQARSMVLTDVAAAEYFGRSESYLHKEIKWGYDTYVVVGVVKEPNTSNFVVKSDVFMPISLLPDKFKDHDLGYFGGCNAVILNKKGQSEDVVINEINHIQNTIEMKDDFDVLHIRVNNVADLLAQPLFKSNNDRSGQKFLWIIFTIIGLFLLIPTINLINLNMTRIYERSSEIGVRKAFGAQSKDLLFQFIFENMILTILGGVIGFLLAFLIINGLNGAAIIENSHLQFNFKIFFTSLIITLFFGLCSGIIPAWRMSKKQIASTIKTNRI